MKRNKKKRKNFRIANIILTIILTIALTIMSISIFAIYKFCHLGINERKMYDNAELADQITVEKIGKRYENSVQYGYTCYRLRFPINSIGTDFVEFVDAEPESSIDSDYYVCYSNQALRYEDRKVVPPAQTGYVETVIQVKDELDAVNITYYLSYYDSITYHNKQEVTIQLK